MGLTQGHEGELVPGLGLGCTDCQCEVSLREPPGCSIRPPRSFLPVCVAPRPRPPLPAPPGTEETCGQSPASCISQNLSGPVILKRQKAPAGTAARTWGGDSWQREDGEEARFGSQEAWPPSGLGGKPIINGNFLCLKT